MNYRVLKCYPKTQLSFYWSDKEFNNIKFQGWKEHLGTVTTIKGAQEPPGYWEYKIPSSIHQRANWELLNLQHLKHWQIKSDCLFHGASGNCHQIWSDDFGLSKLSVTDFTCLYGLIGSTRVRSIKKNHQPEEIFWYYKIIHKNLEVALFFMLIINAALRDRNISSTTCYRILQKDWEKKKEVMRRKELKVKNYEGFF